MASDGGEGIGQAFSASFADGVLRLGGELDLHAIHDVLGHPLVDLVDPSSDVVVDLTDLSFIDSFGLTELVRIAQAMDGNRMIIRGARPHARKVFDLTGIGAVAGLEIEEEQ